MYPLKRIWVKVSANKVKKPSNEVSLMIHFWKFKPRLRISQKSRESRFNSSKITRLTRSLRKIGQMEMTLLRELLTWEELRCICLTIIRGRSRERITLKWLHKKTGPMQGPNLLNRVEKGMRA
jgi:hypothetical protein